MTDFRDLILAHRGKRMCVMGGAGTLAEQLPQVEADIYISTNAHGVELRTPDYVLAMDDRNSREDVPMLEWVRGRTGAPTISPHHWADYQLLTWPQAPRQVLSGMVATWAAYMMGAKVVILAGMDGYGGNHGYTHEAVKMARDVGCPVRIVGGGPLTKAWPAYDPAERFGRYKEHSGIRAWLGVDEPITIRVRKSTHIRGVERQAGFEQPVMRHEVARLLKHKMVEEV